MNRQGVGRVAAKKKLLSGKAAPFTMNVKHPGFMQTSLRVTGVLSGLELSVVLGFGFCRWTSPEAVHKPGRVVPTDPRRGDVLQVGQAVDRPAAERRTLPDALGFVQGFRCSWMRARIWK